MKDENEKLVKEWEERVRALPITTIRNDEKLRKYCQENGFGQEDIILLMTIVSNCFPYFWRVEIAPDTKISFGELLGWYESAQVSFIVMHRVFYFFHQSMLTVYDLLEKEKKLKFMVKKRHVQAEAVWKSYIDPQMKGMEMTAWCTLQDHLDITYDMLLPRLEKVFESVRDYMIRLGWRDIELKARIEVAMLLGKVARHSFCTFFKDYMDSCGVNFCKCFEYADLSKMEDRFADMSDALGIKVKKDKYGSYDISGFDVDKNIRVKWAWDDFIADLRDEDLMDESARRAICLNPKIEEDYSHVFEEEDKKSMEESVKRLGDKYKVIKSKS